MRINSCVEWHGRANCALDHPIDEYDNDNDKICDRCCRSSAFEIPGKIMTVELVMLGELWLLQVMKMYLVDEPLRLEWIGFNVRGERS